MIFGGSGVKKLLYVTFENFENNASGVAKKSGATLRPLATQALPVSCLPYTERM